MAQFDQKKEKVIILQRLENRQRNVNRVSSVIQTILFIQIHFFSPFHRGYFYAGERIDVFEGRAMLKNSILNCILLPVTMYN